MKYKYVNELMTTPALYCEEEMTISQVINIFKEHNIGFLPITKSNILVGVVTDRDVLIRSFDKFDLSAPIKSIMTDSEIEFISPNDLLVNAAKVMASKKIRRLVVTNDGKIVGVLTTKDLIKEESLIGYAIETYNTNNTLKEYAIYDNSNPHDSIKVSDYPL